MGEIAAVTRDVNPRQNPRLSREQCERLHHASLRVLESTGVRLLEPGALDLMRKAGVTVTEGNRVRIPSRLVEWALSTAPSSVTLYDRHGKPAMEIGGYRNYYGPGSDCLNIIDHHTWERRKPILQDVVNGVKLCDALSEIDFIMSLWLPVDVEQSIADLHQMVAMLNHSSKPIIYVTPGFEACADLLEMLEVVAGGADAFRQKPQAALYINVLSGLVQNQDSLQKLLFMAERGLPITYSPGAWTGVNSPVTMAGSNVIATAGALVGLVLSQLKREGTPFIFKGSGGGPFDMRSMIIRYAAPDRPGWGDSIAHHYNLPMWSIAGASESKLVDQQAGIEAALLIFSHASSGAHLIHDLGYLESGLSGSLAQLLICAEIVSWVEHFWKDFDVSDEALAVELIEELGPDGDYMGVDHTRRHYREHWYGDLFERDTYENWLAKGGKTLAERAADRVDAILAKPRPEFLTADVQSQLGRIVQRAESQRAGSS